MGLSYNVPYDSAQWLRYYLSIRLRDKSMKKHTVKTKVNVVLEAISADKITAEMAFTHSVLWSGLAKEILD